MMQAIRRFFTAILAPFAYWGGRLKRTKSEMIYGTLPVNSGGTGSTVSFPAEFVPIAEIGTFGLQLAAWKKVKPQTLELSRVMDTVVMNKASVETLTWIRDLMVARSVGLTDYRDTLIRWFIHLGDLPESEREVFELYLKAKNL